MEDIKQELRDEGRAEGSPHIKATTEYKDTYEPLKVEDGKKRNVSPSRIKGKIQKISSFHSSDKEEEAN